MSRSLIIIGTGGGALDVLDVIEASNATSPLWSVAGFLDDASEPGDLFYGIDVLGGISDAARFPECAFIKAIGSERSYQRLPRILASAGVATDQFATLSHPTASVSRRAILGRGVLVNHGVSVGGGVAIGDHVVLCPGAIVGHDTRVGDFGIVAPGAVISGHVAIERNCYIGAGAVVRQGIRIGEGSLVGMGAVVIRDVEPGTTVVGNPARRLRSNGYMRAVGPSREACHEPG
jgi:sugar O-acyltransferase (sialic acid O-acetyltransferase NeuD family)